MGIFAKIQGKHQITVCVNYKKTSVIFAVKKIYEINKNTKVSQKRFASA